MYPKAHGMDPKALFFLALLLAAVPRTTSAETPSSPTLHVGDRRDLKECGKFLSRAAQGVASEPLPERIDPLRVQGEILSAIGSSTNFSSEDLDDPVRCAVAAAKGRSLAVKQRLYRQAALEAEVFGLGLGEALFLLGTAAFFAGCIYKGMTRARAASVPAAPPVERQ